MLSLRLFYTFSHVKTTVIETLRLFKTFWGFLFIYELDCYICAHIAVVYYHTARNDMANFHTKMIKLINTKSNSLGDYAMKFRTTLDVQTELREDNFVCYSGAIK